MAAHVLPSLAYPQAIVGAAIPTGHRSAGRLTEAPSLRTSNARPYACLTQAHSLFYVPSESGRGIFYPYSFSRQKKKTPT